MEWVTRQRDTARTEMDQHSGIHGGDESVEAVAQGERSQTAPWGQ